MNNKKDYYLPFLLTAIVIIVDQVTKILVVKYMSVNEVIPVIVLVPVLEKLQERYCWFFYRFYF